MSRIPYRPYIDGFRALAVLAVVLNHAHIPGMTGGFVGVDIFFVLSGFLITSIITADLRNGEFSLVGFWERRVRRIFPALFAVVLFTLIGSYVFILYPQDYHHVGTAFIAQSFFASNLLFFVHG